MKVKIYENISGAKEARGTVVIIDVFRAFSLEPYLFSRGAEKILAVGEETRARRLKEENPEAVLVGERGGVRLPGFAFGNSPSQTEGADWEGKTVIHTTSAGTQGLAAAVHAEQILAASLVNAAATASFLKKTAPEQVSLVAMGLHGTQPAIEDTLCAEYLESLLLDKAFDMEGALKALRQSESALRFFRPENREVFPEGDYYCCTAVDRFDFALRALPEGDGLFRMIPIRGEMPPEEKVVRLLNEKGWHISFAESCTGGKAAGRLVDVPSASSVFDGSFVTYANEAKMRLLGVEEQTISAYGVVSEQVAREMAEGCALAMKAEVGVGITGVAGPAGGTEKKPVGMVCFGFHLPGKTVTFTEQFGNMGRNRVREKSIEFVFDTLIHLLEEAEQ